MPDVSDNEDLPRTQWLHAEPQVLWIGETYVDAVIFRKSDNDIVTVIARDEHGRRCGYPVDCRALIDWLSSGIAPVGRSLGSDDTPANRAHADQIDRAVFPDRPESDRYIPRPESGK